MNKFMFNNKCCTANQLIDACVFDDRNKIIATIFHFMKTTCVRKKENICKYELNALPNNLLLVVVGMEYCIYLRNHDVKHCRHPLIAIVIA